MAATRISSAYGLTRLAMQIALAGLLQRPRRISLAERLATLPRHGLPVAAPVAIRWDDHLVPCIEAEHDRDLAVALGVVHAHLRLAQIEMMRRLAYGRVAEAAGPAAVGIDHALRLIDPVRAVPAIRAMLPAATRDWLEGFAAGINHYLATSVEWPLEFRLLGVTAEPWTIDDILAVGRLCAADLTWLLWARLLPGRARAGAAWPEIWRRLLADGVVALVGAEPDGASETLREAVLGSGRNGSNALAVSAGRSATGHPWLAGDPHLSIGLPSVWLAASYRSPSYNVAGLMIPGIPVMAVGRNRGIAWGGTSLHAEASELFDVTALPAAEIAERRVRLPVRWSRPRELVLRETCYGPIVSDLPLLPGRPGERLAMRWIGHYPSDEISALLAINRARDAAEFRQAAAGFAVPAQTFVFAERGGSIGTVLAAWMPRRSPAPGDDLVSPTTAASAWRHRATAADFPAEIDPDCGFLVSANERRDTAGIPVSRFFSPTDRAARMSALLRAEPRIGLAELAALQRDVLVPANLAIRDRLLAALAPAKPDRIFETFAGWDGNFDPESAGALAYELVLARTVGALIEPERRRLYGAIWHGRKLLAEEIAAQAPERLSQAVRAAFAGAASEFERLRNWGGAHRLRLAHPFGRLPGIGRQYRHRDWAWPGSGESVLKSGHGLVAGRHAVSYGSNARYLFDLSDPNGNHVAILGGQDGASGSPAFLDQAELFRRGEYIRLPLEPAAARAEFRHSTVLRP